MENYLFAIIRPYMGLVNTIYDYPKISILIFITISTLTLHLLSSKNIKSSISGMFRVFSLIFTTPFLFIKTSLGKIVEANTSEEVYKNSRTLTLNRLNKILYLGIVFTSLLILSTGITASFISLYPSLEIDERNQNGQTLADLKEKVRAQDDIIERASSPTYVKTLQDKKAAAFSEYEKSVAESKSLIGGYTGPAVDSIKEAESTETLDEIKSGLDAAFQFCPGATYEGFKEEDCAKFKATLLRLIDNKIQQLATTKKWNAAKLDLEHSGDAVETAKKTRTEIGYQVIDAQKTFDESSLTKREWIGTHVSAFLGLLFQTLFSLIAMVWTVSISIDLLSWLVLVLRWVEKQADKEVI